MKIYAPGEQWLPGQFPALLAIGDSWFWYPRNNLLHAIATHPRVQDPFRQIQSLGYNGAKLEDLVFGKYAKQLARELRPENVPFYSAILISGAGNDAVDYRLGLKKDCAKAQKAEDCIDDEAMDALMGRLGTAVGAMIHQIWRASGKQGLHPAVILHSYDYPVPDGRGFKLEDLKLTGPWLAPAMDERKVAMDAELRRQICRILIDRLFAEFAQFADRDKRIYLVDSRGCLTSSNYLDDWDNELHPTTKGFQRIVDDRWLSTFRVLSIAA